MTLMYKYGIDGVRTYKINNYDFNNCTLIAYHPPHWYVTRELKVNVLPILETSNLIMKVY